MKNSKEENKDEKNKIVNICVPKASQNIPYTLYERNQRPVTVKELAAHYGLNIGTIYSLIKTEPDFPYINVGIKKKFMVDLIQFEAWINKRTEKQKHEYFKIPSSFDLIKIFKNNRIRNDNTGN